MAAYQTQQDLVVQVLANLGVLAAGQAIDPEDNAYVVNNLDSIFRKLAALEIVYVPDANNIPGPYFRDLSFIVAGELAEIFGLPPDDIAMRIKTGLGSPPGSGTAAMSLKQLTRGKPTYEPLRIQYF